MKTGPAYIKTAPYVQVWKTSALDVSQKNYNVKGFPARSTLLYKGKNLAIKAIFLEGVLIVLASPWLLHSHKRGCKIIFRGLCT